MKAKAVLSLIAAGLLAWAAPASAQDILEKVINAPLPEAFTFNGLKSPPKPRNDASFPAGGKTVRIKVPGKGANPWDVSVGTPVRKPVKAGDELILAFWARLHEGEGGATSAQLPYNAVQLAKEPYTALFSGPATITPEWKLHEVKGRAGRDYAADEINISLHLATGKQVIDLGPIFLLDMSQ